MIIKGIVTFLHWDDKNYAIQEATLEVLREDGSTQMFVIQILRMSDRIKKDADTDTNGK